MQDVPGWIRVGQSIVAAVSEFAIARPWLIIAVVLAVAVFGASAHQRGNDGK